MILIFKHSTTFQDIIAKVTNNEDAELILKSGIQSVSAVKVSDPFILAIQQAPDQSGNVELVPIPFSYNLEQNKEIILDTSHFLTTFSANKKLEDMYTNLTSNIQIATELPR